MTQLYNMLFEIDSLSSNLVLSLEIHFNPENFKSQKTCTYIVKFHVHLFTDLVSILMFEFLDIFLDTTT